MSPTLGQCQALLLGAGAACASFAALQHARSLLAAPAAAWLEGSALQLIRAGFLLFGLALAAGALGSWRARGELWPGDPRSAWALIAWLVWFIVLHINRIKAFKGRATAIAGLAGWALCLLAWLGLGGPA